MPDADAERPIEEVVVRVSPDLSGFRRRTQADLRTAMTGIGPAKIPVVADLRGFRRDLRTQLRNIDIRYKVKVEADATHLRRSIQRAINTAKLGLSSETFEVKMQVDEGALQRSLAGATRRYRSHQEQMDHLREQAYQQDAARTIGRQQAVARAERQAYAEAEKRRADSEAAQTRIAERAERDRQRRTAALRKFVGRKQYGPTIIDRGGEGVRPMNALYGVVTAMTPALFAMGASAVQASTSVAALGAAGIGAGLGLTALVVGFKRIRETLALREQVRKEATRDAANADDGSTLRNAVRQVADARRALRDANRSVADSERSLADAQRDALRARRDINAAYREAARDLRELREQVSDLALQETGANLDVQEAMRAQTEVNSNYWASALQRQQAAHRVREAEERVSDIQRERAEKTRELADSERKGVAGSDKVTEARRRAAEANRRVIDQQFALADANLRVADAQAAVARSQDDLARVRRGDGGNTSSAAAQLAAEIAKMTPAAKAMYYWVDKNRSALGGLRDKIEQATLPGFTQFLREITDRGKDGNSTLSIMADQAATMGGIVGRTVARLGALSKQPFFRDSMAKVGKENAAAFKLWGQSATILLRPLSRIVAAAAPLSTRFAKAFKDMAERFSGFIERAHNSGALEDWFKRAGDAFARWVNLGKSVVRLVMPIFKEALPTGNNLVERLTSFITELGDWANSPAGARQISDFFDKFRNLKYGDIAQMLTQLTVSIGAFRAVRAAGAHPYVAAFALLGTIDPETTKTLLTYIADFAVGTLKVVNDNKEAAGTLLAIFAASKTVGKLLDIGVKLPGIDNLRNYLTSKFKFLDDLLVKKIPTMTVHAGTVNIHGPAGGKPGGAGSTPAPVPVGGGGGDAKAGKGGWKGKLGRIGTGAMAALGPAAWVAMGTGAVMEMLGMDFQWDPVADAAKAAKDFKQAFKEEMQDPFELNSSGVGHWFSITLPNALNPGAAGSGGWAGLATNMRHWFAITLPEAMSGRGGGWSGFGGYVKDTLKEMLGVNAVTGTWQGISEKASWLGDKLTGWKDALVAKVKELFGVQSPSTVFAAIGADLIAGLWQGFTTKWDGLLKTVQTWIGTNITGPLRATFTAAGTGIRDAFVSTFNNLSAKLAAPVKSVLDWIDRNLIDRLNAVLGAVGVQPIPNINFGVGTPAAAPQARTGLGDRPAVRARAQPVRRADGGRVPGFSPHPRADNIPAMLTADEYVHPVDAVKHYGVSFMDKIRRKEIPRYADGGLVESMTRAADGPNLVTNVAGAAIKRMGGDTIAAIAAKVKDALLGFFDGGGTAVGDIEVARIAEATARSMGATNKQLLALISAGVVESGMRNLNYGDRDSLGFLQQRPSQGWGTPAQIMDVAYATRQFISRAKRADRGNQTPGQLAQAVQRSAKPGLYDQRLGDAYAIINREAPFITGGGGGFGAWPSSPAAQRGDSGIWRRIVALARTSGIPFRVTSTYRDGDPRWHGSGRGVDFGGHNQDALAQFFLTMKDRILEMIHRTDTRDYGVRRGRDHRFPSQWPQHEDHLHVAMAGGGLVPRRYDTGGILPPGVTLAVNQTGRNETIRTHEQEQALGDGRWMRLDRRDLALLAQYIAQASNRPIHMDGRKVAEIVHGYSYLPGGM